MTGGLPSAFTSADIEAGRKLFAGDWRFAAAAGSAEALPRMRGIEVAIAERAALLAATEAALARHPAAHPQVLVTSARSGAGIAELRAAMARLVNERATG
jgi:hypothetical protein